MNKYLMINYDISLGGKEQIVRRTDNQGSPLNEGRRQRALGACEKLSAFISFSFFP